MSKELEALEKLTNYKCSCMSEKIKCKETIKTALKESIEIKDKYAKLQAERIVEKVLNEKKLKALEIIKESIPIEGEDFFYDKETDTYLFIGNKVSKEQFYLLKEVLL